MQVEDTLFSRAFTLKTKDIYPASIDILDSMACFGNVIEKKHEFETDGPRKGVHLFFDVEDIVDDHASMLFSFLINGESNGEGLLEIDVHGSFSIDIEQGISIGTNAFTSFYLDNTFPDVKKYMESRLKQMEKLIEKRMAKLKFKYP